MDLEVLGERRSFSIAMSFKPMGNKNASINGAYVALCDALNRLKKRGLVEKNPIKEQVAAVSVVSSVECLFRFVL